MSLPATFSVTPLNMCVQSYDSVKGEWRYYAHLNCFGTFLEAGVGRTLRDQYNQNKAVFAYSPLSEPAPATMPSNWTKYSVAQLYFWTNATTDKQYLLIYHVASQAYQSAKAAFYLNGNLVRLEIVEGDQYVALLVDCPPPQTHWIAYMFLAGGRVLELKGIQCYVL